MYQIREQTHEEKVKMYMKLPKKQIIEMLIEANKSLGYYQRTTTWSIPSEGTLSLNYNPPNLTSNPTE